MRVVSSRPFATKIHWIVAALWLAALSLPAWSEISWIDTYKSKGWPNSTASCTTARRPVLPTDFAIVFVSSGHM